MNLCPRCLILNLNLSDDELVRKPEEQIQRSLSERWPSLSNEFAKEGEFCHFCLGMLQDSFLHSCAEEISKKVQSENYKCSNFRLMVSQPVQLLLFNKHFNDQHHDVISAHRRSGNGVEIKDIMKIYLEPRLAESLSLKALTKGSAELEIALVIKHDESENVLLPKIEQLFPKCFQKARKINEHLEKKTCRRDLTIFNQSTINEALKCFSNDQLSAILKGDYYLSSVSLNRVSTIRLPVFLAGRYCKYSRELSQTPWFLDGKRKSEFSVEEYIGLPAKARLNADGYNFSSSGREDIDVQMLGTGRPFLLEMINARDFSCDVDIVKLQRTINQGTDLVKVHDLQVVTKEDTKNLKDGEETKTKSYLAICYARFDPATFDKPKHVLSERIEELSKMTNIKIQQKTPIRVLHRRNLTTRTKLVYIMKAEITSHLDDLKIQPLPTALPDCYLFFKLYLTTQAGTYVKEFVHGDFGRTIPNIRSLLGADADILSLDVTAVNLDWPPEL